MRSVPAPAMPDLRPPPPPPPPPLQSVPRSFPVLPPPPLHNELFDRRPPVEPTEPVRWRWRDLWVLGAITFGLPTALTIAFAPRDRFSQFLDGMLYFQIVGYVLGALLVVYMIRRLQDGDWSTLGLTWSGGAPRELLAGAGLGALLIAFFLPLSLLLSGGRIELTGLIRELIGSTTGLGLALAAVVVVIGAPIMEEIYYRGMLLGKLMRRNTSVAIIVTTFLFTIAHGGVAIPAIVMLGIILAWKRQTKSLWYTIGAHAMWNLAIMMMAVVMLWGTRT